MTLTCAIIDDEPLAISLLESYVNKTPFLRLTAKFNSALEALPVLSAQPVELLFLDIQMPEMDGYKATQAIRNLPDRDKACIPIIAMTANAFEEDKRDAIAAGMNGHIAKPIQVDKLLSILSEVIRKQSLYRLKNGTMGKTDDVFADNVIY